MITIAEPHYIDLKQIVPSRACEPSLRPHILRFNTCTNVKNNKNNNDDDDDDHDHDSDRKDRKQNLKFFHNWIPLLTVFPEWKFFRQQCPTLNQVSVLDCGGDGSCMFHCVAGALNSYLGGQPRWFSSEEMRTISASYLTHENYLNIFDANNIQAQAAHQIKNISKQDLFLLSNKNPNKVLQLKTGRRILADPSYEFWGDPEVLRHLLFQFPLFQKLQLGFAVIKSRTFPIEQDKMLPLEHRRRYLVVDTYLLTTPNTKHFIFLHSQPNFHWLLVGVEWKTTQQETIFGNIFPMNRYPVSLHWCLQEKRVMLPPLVPISGSASASAAISVSHPSHSYRLHLSSQNHHKLKSSIQSETMKKNKK